MALNPHQRNKVDVSSMTEEEQKLFRLYGKLPNKKDLLQNKLKGQERKYFDSGDYALSKAGKASDVGVTSIGREHPSPENIPHLTQQNSHPGNPGGVSTASNPNAAGLNSPAAAPTGTSPPNSATNAPSQVGSSLNPRVSNAGAGAEDGGEGVVSGGQ
ncbi:Endosulfine-domain-containing protein [Viridothelium virens]|uniref:mRNA stability protein n=1 Tax=Viridothelium virens TaxID=1048519 RepID=A0A6A6H8I3_VIRVR|nr:Endosulfine-domain-containing protein [Viridothelium virens]